MPESLSYKQAGVDLAEKEESFKKIAESLETDDARVLNRMGAFASLFDIHFPEYDHPVLVFKMEEPGSKQKLALQHGDVATVSYDTINHLVNDIIVMGARPLAVQDLIVCGKLEKDVVTRIVDAMAAACRAQGCTLTGGETSEQPGVVEEGLYVLAASIVGVVEKSKIIDGSRIRAGDVVVSLAANGLHTNGYSLVRALMRRQPDILEATVGEETFLEAILRPHKGYYPAVKGLFDHPGLHGMAHITGGGVRGNLSRILPPGLDAAIRLDRFQIPPVFHAIRDAGHVADDEMLQTFNMGVGMTLVVAPDALDAVSAHLASAGCAHFAIGEIVEGNQAVQYHGALGW